MTPNALVAENETMINSLALLAENRRLRAMLAAAGLPPPISPRRYLADLALIIAERHGFTVDDLKGATRSPALNEARQHFMWQARQSITPDGAPRWSFPEIGRFLGRDHTTIIHGVRAYASRAMADLPKEVKP